MSDYDTDLYEWTKAQAGALRRRAANEIDWDNLAEEIESLGRSDQREIESRLENLLLHLLKWKYQPEWQCGSWRGSLYEARRRIKRLLDESPSLRSYPGEFLPEAYAEARARALQETGLLSLPEACEWTIGQILDSELLP